MKIALRTCTALTLVSTLPLLAGCNTPPQAPTSQVALANPASEYCISQGGRLEIVRDAAGDKGVCHLPDGTVIEEWTLYRRDHAQK